MTPLTVRVMDAGDPDFTALLCRSAHSVALMNRLRSEVVRCDVEPNSQLDVSIIWGPANETPPPASTDITRDVRVVAVSKRQWARGEAERLAVEHHATVVAVNHPGGRLPVGSSLFSGRCAVVVVTPNVTETCPEFSYFVLSSLLGISFRSLVWVRRGWGRWELDSLFQSDDQAESRARWAFVFSAKAARVETSPRGGWAFDDLLFGRLFTPYRENYVVRFLFDKMGWATEPLDNDSSRPLVAPIEIVAPSQDGRGEVRWFGTAQTIAEAHDELKKLHRSGVLWATVASNFEFEDWDDANNG